MRTFDIYVIFACLAASRNAISKANLSPPARPDLRTHRATAHTYSGCQITKQTQQREKSKDFTMMNYFFGEKESTF